MTSVSKTTLHEEQREFKVYREVPVVRTSLSPKEVSQIILDHVTEKMRKQFSLEDRKVIEADASPDISWRAEEYEGFDVQIVFGEKP